MERIEGEVLRKFRTGELSIGAACELAGVDRYTFMAECARQGIPVIDYSEEELEQELEALGEP